MLHVGAGQEFESIGAAVAAAKDGNVVMVHGGVYRERVVVNKPITVVAADGEEPIIDGGYSREWAKISGTGWRDLKYRAPAATMGDGFSVRSNKVMIIGFRIVNCVNGVSVGAFDTVTIRDLDIEHVYNTGVLVNGTTGKARDIVVENVRVNVASVRLFDGSRVYSDPQGVSGVLKFGNCENVVVRNCQALRGFGEGINIGKGAVNVEVSGCLVVDSQHKGIYVNRSKQVRIIGNIVAFTGDPGHDWIKQSHPAGIGVNDETARGNYGDSSDITVENNLVIDAGILLQITGDDPQGVYTVRGNTFIWGPYARKGVQIGGPYKGEVRGNLFHVTPGATITTGNPAGLAWGDNRWSIAPPVKWRGEGDVYGDLGLKAPDVMPTAEHDGYGMGGWVSIDVANYRPVEEPEPPDPPVDPDPPPVPDYASIIESLERHLERLEDASVALVGVELAVDEAIVDTHELIDRLRTAAGYIQKESK